MTLPTDLLALGWDQVHSIDSEMKRCRRPSPPADIAALRARIEAVYDIYHAITLWKTPEFSGLSRELWYLISSLRERSELVHVWQVEDEETERIYTERRATV